MSLDTAEKQKLIETHQVHPTDTGSAEVQVAPVSYTHLTLPTTGSV